MEKKYLLGMLFGGAMLAACSTDDFDSVKVAQDVNPSAPVFTVSFDGDNTRAGLLPSGQIGFEPGDLLSLYHGVKVKDNDNFKDFTVYGNAIYEGSSSEDGNFIYTTKAFVNPGGAVMIYPADTAYANKGNGEAPRIIIPATQNEKTKLLNPYMSEILTIGDYNKEAAADHAGYGKKYDIAMKRVGTRLDLKMVIDGLDNLGLPTGVPPIEIMKVELKEAAASATPFTTSIPVKALEEKPTSYNEQKKTHLTWTNQSDLDQENAEGEASITTTDISKDYVATFTLLPSKVEDEENPTIEKGQVIVHTTYGKVTLEDPAAPTVLTDADKVWVKGTENMGINAGLTQLLSDATLWAKATKEGTFKGEKVGAPINRTVNVKISKLNMNGLHIQKESDLVAALEVYKVTAHTDAAVEEVNFILDGQEEADGKFVMHRDTWTKVAEQLAADGNKVSLSLCTLENEACKGIKLVSEAATVDQAEEVPELHFVTLTADEKVNKSTPAKVKVELVGHWKYTTVKEDPTIEENEDVETKVLTGIEEMILVDKTLTLEGFIAAEANDGFKFVVKKDAEVRVMSKVVLQLNMDNQGTINIGSDDVKNGQLNLGAKKTLENCAAVAESEDEKVDGFTIGGVINNYGTLGIVENSNAKINNYGYIYIKSDNAITLVSENSNVDNTKDDPAAFKALFNSETNKIGSIVLKKSDGNSSTTVGDANRQGFIKYEINAEVKSDVTGASSTGIANYIIVTGTTVTSLNTNVLYVEVANEAGVKLNVGSAATEAGAAALTGLIVPEGMRADIPTGKGVKPTVLYVKGTITKAGYMDKYQIEDGYYGGVKGDRNNITTY